MAKIYKYTVYVNDYEEFGSDCWQTEIEDAITNGGTDANAIAYPDGETESFDSDDETLEDFTNLELFNMFNRK